MFKYHLYRAIIYMKIVLKYDKDKICIICELEDDDYDEILKRNE